MAGKTPHPKPSSVNLRELYLGCRIEEMKYLSIFVALIVITIFPQQVFAVSGTCSDHGGVNCAVAPDWDESAVCNDGWTDSSINYFYQVECQQAVMCTQSQWENEPARNTYEMKTDRAHFSDLINQINTLNLDYLMIEARVNAEYSGKGIASNIIDTKISGEQKRNKDKVATLTYEVFLLDKKIRSAQVEINKTCILQGKSAVELKNQQEASLPIVSTTLNTTLSSNKTAQSSNLSGLSENEKCVALKLGFRFNSKTQSCEMTSDERCVMLNLGTWYNTTTQNCDTCPVGEEKDPNANSCRNPQKPIPEVTLVSTVKKSTTELVQKPKTVESSKLIEVKSATTATTTESTQEISTTTTEATQNFEQPKPVVAPPQVQPTTPKTFWKKVITWFKFW